MLNPGAESPHPCRRPEQRALPLHDVSGDLVLLAGEVVGQLGVEFDAVTDLGTPQAAVADVADQLDGARATETSIKVGEYFVELPAGDHAAIIEQLREMSLQIDRLEPFDRIDEAIREAQRVGESTRDVA